MRVVPLRLVQWQQMYFQYSWLIPGVAKKSCDEKWGHELKKFKECWFIAMTFWLLVFLYTYLIFYFFILVLFLVLNFVICYRCFWEIDRFLFFYNFFFGFLLCFITSNVLFQWINMLQWKACFYFLFFFNSVNCIYCSVRSRILIMNPARVHIFLIKILKCALWQGSNLHSHGSPYKKRYKFKRCQNAHFLY